MTLAESLRAVAGLEQLAHLVAALGYRPAWEEISVDSWLGAVSGARGIRRAAVVGRSEGFAWLGIDADDPGQRAAATAGRLLARGEVGGVVALGSGTRQLVVSVAFGDLPSLEVGLDRPDAIALACLERARARSGISGLAQAVLIAEALSGEGVSRRFFEGFRSTLAHVSDEVRGATNEGERHGLALLQLTRVLFLYFVQAKGWLNEEPDFLRRRIDGCLDRGGSIHRDLLRPLFFGTLNRRIGARGRAAQFGRIPFLNGGLFEAHYLERRGQDFSNAVWQSAFDGLFERFHFTVSETGERAAGAAPAVAPDMLGRVFEGVMAPELRRGSGTFYTPAALVGELMEAGLVALIASRFDVGDPEASARLRQGGPELSRLLRDLTVLDPAVGSGGFLLATLERLARLRSPGARPSSSLKREVLRRNLFGVDINPMAVRLAELRLWLAVIADDPEDRPEHVLPLPNLDCLIRQGDTLADPIGLVTSWPLRPARAGGMVAAIRQRFILATGEEKRIAARALRGAEINAGRECLELAAERIELDLAECLGAARAPDLFGERRGLTPKLAQRLRSLRAALHQIRGARRRLDRDGELPWFQFESHFADVFAERGGFDLLVGNPPWVRGERIPPALRDRLKRRYRWWRTAGAESGYAHRPDLAVAFLERAFELTGPGGAMAMLLPSKLATAGYATTARQALGSQATLHAIADLTEEPGARFQATTYPLALVLSKRAPRLRGVVRDALSATVPALTPQATLLGGAPWVLTRPDVREAREAIVGRHPPIAAGYQPQSGAKTGANHLFLNPEAPIEPALIRWAIRGRDVRPFRVELRTRIVWTHDAAGRPFRRLPAQAARHFLAHEARLRARADFTGGPPWMVFRTAPLTAPGRVVWADLSCQLAAVALTGDPTRDPIPLNSCYVLPTGSSDEAHRLAAWLNARWLTGLARLTAMPASGGYARFTASVIAGLPLPASAISDPDLASLGRAGAAGHAIQEELDECCARHLGLTANERSALGMVGRSPEAAG